MTRDRDDDAFSWEGDADPTLDAAPSRASTPADPVQLPAGYIAVGKGADEVDGTDVSSTDAEAEATAPTAAPSGMGNATLVTVGVLGGVYALWTIGWVIGGLRLLPVAGYLVANDGAAPPLWTVGNVVAVWLASLAPAIWFASIFALTRRSRPWVRVALLVLGVVMLVPWPFVMVGAVGA